MEKSEIIEGNKLIAEFMGAKFKNDITFHALNRPEEDLWLPFHGICKHNTIDLGRGQILQYHSSWDWLMSVVEKIDETCPQHPEFEDADTGYSCTLFSATNSPWKIENTYETVIKYIKWYNNQKNTKVICNMCQGLSACSCEDTNPALP